MTDFSPYTPLSEDKSRHVDGARGVPFTWDNQPIKSVASGNTYYSDWQKVSELSADSVSGELLWTGDVDASAVLQGKIDQVPFDLPLDLTSIEPSGHAYSGDLGADNLALEDLGNMPFEVVGSPGFTHVRLKLTVSSGDGSIAGNLSVSRTRAADV